jgi:hypothetical protein
MKGMTLFDGTQIGIRIKPLIGGKEQEYTIDRSSKEEWPVQFYTNTTDLRDFIGNVTTINNGRCSVKGVYRGVMRELKNVRICSPEIKKSGDRVMVTEHVNVSGKFDFIATKKRILSNTCHFVNVGWSSDRQSKYLIVDIYTGEVRETQGSPVFMMFKGKGNQKWPSC